MREWCREMRSRRNREVFSALSRKLEGYYRYYGVIGNGRMLWAFYEEVLGALRQCLSRRSQNGYVSLRRFDALIAYHGLPRPRITDRRGGQLRLSTC